MLTATDYSVLPQNSSCNFSCNDSEESVGRLLWSYAKGLGGVAAADDDGMLALPSWQVVVFGILSASTSLLTVVGNLIVILSFIIERSIRQTSNYFIASLAVSDLLIGCFSMPLYTVYMLSGQHWTLGEVPCDLWLSLDYTVCLCSIYTVFCITVDRYCSVTIPAKYHRWRTERKVVTIVGVTWTLPVMVFFTSIIGWQYFVHERTVPEGKCYVQYMDSALFNCLLQVGYFWVTLVVMCGLYAGIYRVALRLHRKSESRRKKMTSLVSMAGRTMTNIGIGMTGQQKQQRREVTASSAGHQKQQQQQENPARSPSEECKKPLIHRSQLGNNQAVESRTDWRKDTKWKTTQFSANSTSAVRDIIFTNNFNKNDRFSEDIREDSTAGVRMYRHSLQVFSSQLPDSSLFLAKPKHRPAGNQSSPSSNPHQIQMIKDTNDDTDISRCQTKVTDSQLHFHIKPVTERRLPNNRDRKRSANHERRLLSRDSLITNHERQILSRESLTTNRERQILSRDSLEMTDGDDDFGRSPPIPFLCGHCSGARSPLEQLEAEERETDWNQLHPADIFPRSASISNTENNHHDDPNDSVDDRRPPSAAAIPVTNAPQRDWPPVTKRTLLRSSLPADFLGFYATVIDKTDERFSCIDHSGIIKAETKTTTADDQSGDDRPSPLAEPSLFFANAQQQTSCESDCPEQVHLLAPPSSSTKTSGAISSGGSAVSSVPEQKRRRRSRFLASRQQWSSRRRRAAAAAAAKRNAEDADEMGDDDDRHQDGSGGRQQLKRKNENRAMKSLRTITLILGAFVVCWTPWHVLSLIIGFCPESSVCVPPILYDVSYWLCYINSPMNPFCYAFANQQFKKTFVRILRFDWHRT